MPIIRDDENLTTSNIRLSLGELLNTFAFLLKAITGENSWKTPASISIAELAQGQSYPGLKGDKGDKGDTGLQGVQGLKGDKGDIGAQGIQGLKGDTGDKGDKGDPGEPAPINHTHTLAQVEGLQTALDAKATVNHYHLPEAWQNLTLSTGWINYPGTGYALPQCRKLANGLIEVKGTIKKTSALVANELLTTLPEGYRPSEIRMIQTWTASGDCRLIVNPNGLIQINAGNPAGVALNFIFGLN